MAWEVGDPVVSGARVQEVDIASLVITDEQRRRFKRAMMALQLKPYIHGSEEYDELVCANIEVTGGNCASSEKHGPAGEKRVSIDR